MKAALYCRVSTDEQREKQSIETQIDFARRYADLHEIEIVDTYKDDGVSGGIPVTDRPEGARLLADMAKGGFELLLIMRVDRLSRSQLDLLETCERLKEHNVVLRSMTEPFDTSTGIGEFVLQLLGSLGQLEKRTIIERSVTGSMRRARDGEWLGGMTPLGYKVGEKRKLVVDPEEAQLVHRIFELTAVDKLTLGQIADLLNAEGVLPRNDARGKGIKGRGWQKGTLSKIITNRTYIGENFYNKRKRVRKKGHYVGLRHTPAAEQVFRSAPPIIDPETFTAAQLVLKSNYMRPSHAKRLYLLRGLIKCSVCGAYYSGYSPAGRNVFYYNCAHYKHSAKADRCPSAIVRGDLLEAEVWSDIVSFVENPGDVVARLQARMQAQINELAPVQVEQSTVRENIVARQNERQRVIGLVRKALITDAEAERDLTDLQRQIDALESRHQELGARQDQVTAMKARLGDADSLLQRLRAAAKDATPQGQFDLIHLLVKGITVDTEYIDGKRRPRVHIEYNFEPMLDSIPMSLTVASAGH